MENTFELNLIILWNVYHKGISSNDDLTDVLSSLLNARLTYVSRTDRFKISRSATIKVLSNNIYISFRVMVEHMVSKLNWLKNEMN